MANYHVLDGSEDGNSFRVVFHIAVPASGNRVPLSYQTAVSQFFGTQVSVVPGITSQEQADLTAGRLIEHAFEINTNPGETAGQLQARLDALYNAEKVSAITRLQRRLAYWGYSRNVP